MIMKDKNGQWWVGSELGPEDCPPNKAITFEKAMSILETYNPDAARKERDLYAGNTR